MRAFIETWDLWGGHFLHVAWPMLWQSTLLIALVSLLDFFFARKICPAIRHALWLVVLVKLILPPALALPTGAAWWLWPAKPALVPVITTETVTYGQTLPVANFVPLTAPVPPPPILSGAGWTLLASGIVSLAVFLWLTFRWLQMARQVRQAAASHDFDRALDEARQLAGLRGRVRLKLMDDTLSPAVYGLFRPVILLPRSLAHKLSPAQLRAVLLHEVIHLRRGDVWVNFAQTLLQIFYWWHPLLWLANARIRRVREEAVDDAVVLALRDDAAAYAPTLLEVARFAFRRPLATLGLVGILESRSALRQRIDRLVNVTAPRRARVTLLALCGIFAFAAVALPMGQAPVSDQKQTSSPTSLAVARTKMRAREAMYRKLNSIHLSVSYNEPLSEVLRDLTDQSRKLDPDRQGIHFLFAPPVAAAPINSTTGFSENSPGIDEIADPNAIKIKLTLKNVSLSEVLDDICVVADISIKYSVEDDAVVFAGHPNPERMVMRTFKVDPAFPSELRKQTRIQTNDVAEAFKQLASKNGVDWSQPKSAFFNLRLGMLFVYAMPQDLNVIERLVIKLCNTNLPPANTPLPAKSMSRNNLIVFSPANSSPNTGNAIVDPFNLPPLDEPVPAAPVHFGDLEQRTFSVGTAAFYAGIRNLTGDTNAVEGFKQLASQAGVDLSPPKAVFFNNGMGMLLVHATKTDLETIGGILVGLHCLPYQIHLKTRFLEVPPAFFTDPANSLPPGMTNGGILTAGETKKLLLQLQSQKDVEELAEPEAVTIAGRQTQMRATATQPVLTNYVAMENLTKAIHGDLIIYGRTTQLETGPVFDVIPRILGDGYTLNLVVKASLTTFFGYASPRGLSLHFVTFKGQKVVLPTALPAVQVTQASARRTLYDGQTLVLFPQSSQLLFCPSDEKERERISEHIQTAEQKEGKKILLALVTATLIDDAGNRLHSDDQMPFAQTGFPPSSL